MEVKQTTYVVLPLQEAFWAMKDVVGHLFSDKVILDFLYSAVGDILDNNDHCMTRNRDASYCVDVLESYGLNEDEAYDALRAFHSCIEGTILQYMPMFDFDTHPGLMEYSIRNKLSLIIVFYPDRKQFSYAHSAERATC